MAQKDKQNRGSLYVVSAPSGAGKTSLVKALIETTPGLSVSISHTTRAIRPGEQDGVNYHFVAVEAFQQMVQKSLFLEHAQVFDNFYGTSRESVLKQLEQGDDLILEIDWQGARQVCDEISGTTSIFILPPSREELERRLQSRGQDSDAIIARRMKDAKSEISHYREFDYIVINNDFDAALTELRDVMRTHDQHSEAQLQKHQQLLDDLLA